MDFQIGDRVVLISEYADFRSCRKHDLPRGSIGTVCDVDHPRIGVDWDGCTNGHKCDGRLSSDSGWYVDDDELEPLFLIDDDVAPSDIGLVI